MKTTYLNKVVFILLLLANTVIYAQYNGGDSDGFSHAGVNNASCPYPIQFFAYNGGNGGLTTTNSLINTTCSAPIQFTAYQGGIGDGFGYDTLNNAVCPNPIQYYAYFGGNSDGFATAATNAVSCPVPNQFYAYFGGVGDGFSLGKTNPVCPTEPPVASFTASATTICVGQSVTFTDTSTHLPGAWIWTLPGGTPNSSTVQNPTVVYNTAGTYSVTLQAFNYNGNNTVTMTNYINVIAMPTVTSTTPGSRCDAGTVTLQATASAGTLNWYDAPTLGNLVGTGTSFTTPSISATTTYYVQTVVGGCTSARTAVIATVNATPSLSSTTPASRCGTGNISIQAAAASGTIRWYDLPTGGTLLATGPTFNIVGLAATTTYYVEVTNGSCTSARTAVIATINPMPGITSTTSASRCDAGTVTLLAAASAGTLNWYDAPTTGNLVGTGTSFTTPTIATTTTYYVEAVLGPCTSARTAVTATVNMTPTITATTPGSRCDAGSVTLQATASAGTLNWYSLPSGGGVIGTGATFSTPTIAATTTYYVEAANGSCNSVRVPVVATVNTSPSITSTTPASICSGDSFTISATASAGTLNWYNLPSGGTLLGTGSNYSLGSLGSTTTFYVQAIDGSCSSARTAVEVTVTNRPTNTSTTPASRCGTGTLVLGATFSSGTVNWYDAPLLGNLVGTGSTFVTPVLSVTTIFYAEAVNGSCTSLTRTSVVATVTSPPSLTSTTPAERCGTGNITLQATAGSGTIRWYDLPTGGTLLATGNTLNLIGLSATTTYYAEVVDGTCTSARTAVTATINPIPSITSTTPGSRCDSGTVTLQATASGGTLNWYDAPTLGNLVGTGASFTTPIIGATTIYYVETTSGLCSSARTAVTATVNATPVITATTPGSRCDAGVVTLQASASAGNLNWYNLPSGGTLLGTGSTFNTPSISATTNYYVEAVNGGCTSGRTLVVATVNTSPTITSTTPASICSGDSFTISATASAGTLNWYNLPSGGILLGTGSNYSLGSLASTTTFYVQAIDGSCSSARTAVEVTVTNRPTNTSVTPASRCGNGTVILAASFSSGTINWYDAPVLGNLVGTGSTFVTPILSVTTTYYAEATNGSCTSLTRTPVTATINEEPVLLSTTPASRCGTGTVTLQATATIGTINWYNALTGGTLMGTGGSFTTPSLSATTPYYVEVVNGTCATPSRTLVTATVNAAETITSTTPASRCGAGTLTLNATASGGTINWYDAPTLGNLVGTGSAFTTPTLSATTIYYVEATSGCTGSRTAVTATVNEQPVLLSSTPGSRCGDGVVTLQATATVGTINWWNAPTGGILLGTGSTFITGNLSTTTQFYVEVVNGTCSTARTQVTATVNAVPIITSTTPASRCDTGTLTLQAAASGGTLNWYDAPIGGNLVGTGTSFTTPSLSASATYYVEAGTAGCNSARTAVTATINNVTNISGTTPGSRCGDGTVTLLATTTAGTINWYDAPTGGLLVGTGSSFTTPVLSATTLYYAEAVNGSCTSARVLVTATVYAIATVTSTTPASRCDAGTLTLSAVSNVGTLNWYNLPTGGTLMGTGASFTTPVISATTTYYVEAVNGSCTSARVAVIATINPTAAPTAAASQTFCAGELVSMIHITGSNVIWYDAPTGGNVVPPNTPLVSGTVYYASQTLTGCESPTRVAVTMTLGGCLGNDEFEAMTIKLYPNPVTDILHIAATETMTKVEVVNMLGQMVFSNRLNGLDTTVDMERYAAGTYIILVSAGDKFQTFKVIKK